MKLAIKIGLIVIALLVIIITIIGSRLDSIIKSAVETVGPRVTQTAVKLDSVGISLLSGRGRIRGLLIGNPQGFQTKSAFKLADTRIQLDVGSVLSDRVIIDEVVIDGPEVTYERGPSGSNIDKIQKNVETFGSSPSPDKPSPQDKAVTHKTFQINRLVVKNGRILMSAGFITGKTFEVALPDIELKDIGKNSTGATMKEVTTRVLAAIEADVTQAVASAGKNQAPELEKAASDAVGNIKDIFKK